MKLISVSMMCFFLLFSVFAQENNDSFRQEGIASWYGAEFAGKPTASGELFNPADMTAAHPKLPFGTFLKVTNTHNGKQVVVRVNDRGPFAAARIIDLSQKAAEQLDMIITGTAPVIVEAVNLLPANNTSASTAKDETVLSVQAVPEPSLQTTMNESILPKTHISVQNERIPAQQIQNPEIKVNENPSAIIVVNPAIPPAESGKSYRIQVGSYKNAKYAVDAFSALTNAGLNPAYERYNDLYRVVLAHIKSDSVQSVVDTLAKAGFREILIKEER